MNGSVSITWNKYTRVHLSTLESRSIVSDRPMHPSQLGDRSREGPGRGFIRWVEDQEAFITSHSDRTSQISWLEPEARRAIGLSRPKGKHGPGYDLVDHVWWRPCARRTVFGCK